MNGTSIVLATDLSDASVEAARWAQEASERLNLPVTVIYVVSISVANWATGAYDVLETPAIMEDSRAKVSDWYAEATGKAPAESRVLVGHIPVQIRQETEKIDAAMLVLATSAKTRWKQFFLGSTAQSLAHVPPCPVILVRPEEEMGSTTVKEIAVGIDFSSNSIDALAHSAAHARAAGAKIHLVHAGKSPKFMLGLEHLPEEVIQTDYQKWATEQMNDFIGAHADKLEGIEIETHILEDYPSHGLLEFTESNEVDMLVVGRTGHSSLISDTVGDVLLKVLQSVPTTTCIVPAEPAE
ncbi:universal stress protein [Bradymonas sediminis]|nr:universal stress protein [Bradymonas sediminis]TDP75718.1 nucleotide-binding universal stress UspA family protein [Bradymonas sediminis]